MENLGYDRRQPRRAPLKTPLDQYATLESQSEISVSLQAPIRLRRPGRGSHGVGIGLVDHALNYALLLGSEDLGEVLVQLRLLSLQF